LKRAIAPLQAVMRRTSAALTNPREILSNRFVSAKLLPLHEQKGYTVLLRVHTDAQADGLPVPPPSLSSRWGLTTDSYLRGGQIDAEAILGSLAEVGATVEPASRVLDFGCAEGRVLRFFPRPPESELWGVDISAERIAWAQRHLPAPFRFATTTTAPHLPFEDNYFDLVYCISVFTHISELADAWFLELLRVLRPGGHVYLTIHDETTVELLRGPYRDNPTHAYMVDLVRKFGEETGMLDEEWAYFTILADPAAQVFYNAGYLVDKWGRLADCVSVRPEAIGYQTALIFRKSMR
jgi:SAM-dependent methyltransferase